jgi:hypothetical protein
VIEATSTGGRRSEFFTAEKLAPGSFGLSQQYRHLCDILRLRIDFRFRGENGHAADITATTDFDPEPT